MKASTLIVDHIVCGAINWDTTIFVNRFPRRDEEVRVERVINVPGGKGANVAVASSRILGKRKVAIFGALGCDYIATKQLEILRNEGIVDSLIHQSVQTPSGQAYIIVDSDGKNSILTFKKANDTLTHEMVKAKKMLKAIRDSHLITVIDPPLIVVKILIAQAAACCKTIVWAPGLLTGAGIKKVADIIKDVDFLVLNELEYSSLLSIPLTSDLAKVCRRVIAIAENKELGIIITRGKYGCVLGKDGELFVIPTVNLKDTGLKVLNTVGAGDAFLGTFSAMKILGKDDLESLFMANLSGSIKATREETRASPTLDELVKFSKMIKMNYRKVKI